MTNVIKLINDIFSMAFDVVIPVSGVIVAVLTALLLFSIRYFTFRNKVKKYKGQPMQHRLTPRTKQQMRTSKGYPPLEAASSCDPGIYLLLTDMVANRMHDAESSAGGEIDLRFCAEMASVLRSKSPRLETGGTVQ